MNEISEKLGLDIDEQFYKPARKNNTRTSIKDVVTMIPNYNYMADLIQLPKTTKGFIYLLVIVDLATNLFDCEPIKNKESATVLEATKKIFGRKIIKIPYSSIKTDGGTEFKSVWHKWINSKDIFHPISSPHRHTQLSVINNLCKQIEYYLFMFMNQMEIKTAKPYNNWTDIIDLVRDELNKVRKRKAYTPKTIFQQVDKPVKTSGNKFKVGDVMYYALDYPIDSLGRKQPTSTFRTGDRRWSYVPKKIIKLEYYPNEIRYILNIPQHVAFKENQLMKAGKHESEKFIVEKIIGKKIENRKVYYLIKWKGYPKEKATWEPKTLLIQDGLNQMIGIYEEGNNNK